MQIVFTYKGKQMKETLYVADQPLPPIPASNIAYATRIAAEVREKIAAGTFVFAEYFPKSRRAQVTQQLTIGEFMGTWLAQLDLKRSTKRTYKNAIQNFWKPQLGHLPLSAVRHSHITTALNEGTWASGKSRNNYLSIISGVFELAVADELLTRSPCATIKRAAWQPKTVDPFTLDEANAILASMTEHYPETVLNYYEFRFFTGVRTGEGIGLCWDDIDLAKKSMLVRQAWVQGEVVDTKTSLERTVYLNKRALAALKRQKKWADQLGGRVFFDPVTNKPWSDEQTPRKRYWIPTLARLGLRYRKPSATRHTYATIGLMNNVLPAYMAKQLGHSLKVFYEHYAKWIPTGTEVEQDKLDAAINQNAHTLPK
ncbi:MAG: DUF3596 domain-containing protein [Pseudomonadota bacterium]